MTVQVEAGTDTTWHVVDVAEGTSEVDASTVGAAAREVDAAMVMYFEFHREEGVRILAPSTYFYPWFSHTVGLAT
jgi:hypothetical protein